MDTAATRTRYPSDVGDEEWAFVAPYLTLMREDAPSGSTRCVRSSTACAGWCAPGPSGACCPTTGPPGTGCTSRAFGNDSFQSQPYCIT
jgi:hypothetical protein